MTIFAFTFPSIDWSQWPNWLTNCANIASILTAVIAVIAWVVYRRDSRKKREKLETYLKKEKEDALRRKDDKGQRSMLHLMANVGLTEAEILHASFTSPYILRLAKGGEETPLASAILFEYDPSGTSN